MHIARYLLSKSIHCLLEDLLLMIQHVLGEGELIVALLDDLLKLLLPRLLLSERQVELLRHLIQLRQRQQRESPRDNASSLEHTMPSTLSSNTTPPSISYVSNT